MAEVFNSQFSCEEIEEILASAKGSALISQEDDDTYVMKQVDAEGNLLVGFKLNGEIEVPIGLTDDAYALIQAMYEKLNSAIGALQSYADTVKNYADKTFETIEDSKSLIENSEDDSYVMKSVDANGNLLQGFKTNGEIDVPKGLTDGANEVLGKVIKKMSEMADFITDLEERVEILENNN